MEEMLLPEDLLLQIPQAAAAEVALRVLVEMEALELLY
jgi:hypothetical protein